MTDASWDNLSIVYSSKLWHVPMIGLPSIEAG